jgi:hypothetical protein
VKSQVAWEYRLDALTGFYGRKKNHLCIPTYRVLVEPREVGYNRVMDAFTSNKVGSFARVIMVCPLHSKLCFVDVQMSCHFVVPLIRLFRDQYPTFPVPLHLIGSDACEIFFSKVDSMVGMERAYNFHELIRCANTFNQLAAVEYGTNGL